MNNYSELPPLEIVDGAEPIGDSLVKFNSNTLTVSSAIDFLVSDLLELTDVISRQNTDASTSYGKILELASNIDVWKTLSDTVANLTYTVSTLLTSNGGGGNGGSSFDGGMITSDLSGLNATFVGAVKADTYYGNGDALTGAVNSTRAYIIFDGTGDIGAIEASSGKWGTNYNVTSVNKDAVGTYTVTFTNPMNSAFYCYSLNSGGNQQPYVISRSHNAWNVYSMTVENRSLAGDLIDSPEISMLIFDTAI